MLLNQEKKAFKDRKDAGIQLAKVLEQYKNKGTLILGVPRGGIEVGYQVKDYVDYFVASEASEPAHGWDYQPFLNELSMSYLSPEQLSISIVNAYNNFYSSRTRDYTQSAVNLNQIGPVKENLNNIVFQINQCEKRLGTRFKNIINRTRQKCLEFDEKDYIDLSR